MKEIFVPALGESITEATLASIKKKVGDSTSEGEVLFELETDKVTLEVNSPIDGVLTSLKVNVGDNVEIGALLATLEEGKAVAAQPAQDVKLHDKQDAPAAKKIMIDHGIKREEIISTGKDGRINKADVMQTISNKTVSNITAEPAPNATNEARVKRVKMSKLRQKVAQRLKDSQNTAAILSTFNEIDMKSIMDLRAKYKEPFQKKHAVKLGFMSFFVKAVIASLKDVPDINAEICGDEILYKNYYDIGVAVGTDQGLVVPVIRDADKLSIAEIESEIFRLGTTARDGKLTLAEMQGGTFTISNGGVYGSLLSTPIINPPQSGILGMHTIQKRPVAIGDKIEIRPMMYVALSYDHRVVDGKGAVTFLVKLKQYIEDIQRLLIDL